jgi:hypothetical protein
MATDAHDVGRAPASRHVIQQLEFGRQQFGIVVKEVDVSIDPRGKRLGNTLGIGTVGEPFTVHVTPVQK